MVQIIFNYNGDLQALKDAYILEFGKSFLITYSIPEMIEGTYLTIVKNADDFDTYNDYMDTNGICEVISGWTENGNKYAAKKDKNKFEKTKYKKYLKDIQTWDPVKEEMIITKATGNENVLGLSGWINRNINL